MKCTAVVLAGGRGTRVGGADKGLLPWGEETLIEAVISVISPQVDELIISCNRNLDRYRGLGYPVISDELAGFQGPLAGMCSAMAATDGDYVVFVPCDCPTPPLDLVDRLLQPLRKERCQLSYADDGERAQYLFSAMRRACLPALQRYLASGERSVKGLHAALEVTAVDFSDCGKLFVNLNRG